MSNIFHKALAHTLKWEGGATITRDPHDPGGVTKYGISQVHHPEVDVENLTLEEATRIYLEDYWLPLNCEAIAAIDEVLAAKVFDMGVNLGIRRASKIFQAAIQTMAPGLAVDGNIGPKTLTALAPLDIDTVKELVQERLQNYYLNLDNPRFEKGWLNRAKSWLN